MYIPRTPLRRRAPWIAVAIAAIAGGGAMGLTQVSGGGSAVAAVPAALSPTAGPTAAPTPEFTPAPSLPTVFTPAVNTGWELPAPNDPLLVLESSTPTPRATPTHTPRPSSTPTPKPTKTPTPSPTPTSTPTPQPDPTCSYGGRSFGVGTKLTIGRAEYECTAAANGQAGWVKVPQQPTDPASTPPSPASTSR